MRTRSVVVVALVLAAGACSSGTPSVVDAAAVDQAAGGAPGSGGAAATGGSGGGAAPDLAGTGGTPVVDATDSGPADRADAPPVAPRTVGELYCPPGAPAVSDPLPANRNATLVPIAPPGGISFLEGPVWLADRGVLLLSEWNGGHRILQVTPPQAVEVFLPGSGTNGLAVTADGKSLLVVTEAPAAGVSRINLADKAVQRVVPNYNGQNFIQPNDLVVRVDGTMFFTDYQAGRLYRRAVDGTLSIISSLPRSNGVGLSPDEKTLYLNADTHTVKYPIAADGTIGAGMDLATDLRGADGLAIDCAGNVFIAQNMGGSVVVVSAAGTRLGTIGGLPMVVTNAAFGGADRQTLYITTSSALYTLRTQIAGLPY